MINRETLSDKPIEGIQEVYLSYGRQRGPVPPGTYRGFVSEIVEVRSFPNPPSTLLKLNFEVSEVLELKFGSLEEVHEGHLIRWQKIYKNWGKPSMADALLRSAGIQVLPRSNSELEEVLGRIQETRKLLTFEVDWQGVCYALRDQTLMELTGTSNSEEAKRQASREDWKQANRISLRARNSREFPDATDGKGKLSRYFDDQIGEEIIARVKIHRFLPSRDF